MMAKSLKINLSTALFQSTVVLPPVPTCAFLELLRRPFLASKQNSTAVPGYSSTAREV